MQTKVGLILLLRNYRITLNDRTELPLILEPSALLMTTKNKIWLDFEKIANLEDWKSLELKILFHYIPKQFIYTFL